MMGHKELKKVRLNAGLTQQQAADVVGASRHGFGQAERGEFETVNQAWIRLLLIWPELSDDQRSRLLAA
jgi:Predicted transcriptional regulators